VRDLLNYLFKYNTTTNLHTYLFILTHVVHLYSSHAKLPPIPDISFGGMHMVSE